MVPLNPTPFALDVALSILIPRAMTIILIAVTLGYGGWFWLHVIVALFLYFGSTFSATSD